MLPFSPQIPAALAGLVDVSALNVSKGDEGKIYTLDLYFPKMQTFRTIRSHNLGALESKLRTCFDHWHTLYLNQQTDLQRISIEDKVTRLNLAATRELQAILQIFEARELTRFGPARFTPQDTLSLTPQQLVADDKLRSKIIFQSGDVAKPLGVEQLPMPMRPSRQKHMMAYGRWDRIFNKKDIQASFDEKLEQWRQQADAAKQARSDLKRRFEYEVVPKYQSFVAKHKQSHQDALANHIQMQQGYQRKEKESLLAYVESILCALPLPPSVSLNIDWQLDFHSPCLKVRLHLPDSMASPEVKSYYTAQGNLYSNTYTETQRAQILEQMQQHLALLCLHQIFLGDQANHIERIALLGLLSGEERFALNVTQQGFAELVEHFAPEDIFARVQVPQAESSYHAAVTG